MVETINQQLKNQSSSKYNLIISILNIDIDNQISNNDSTPFHEFEHTSFNATKFQEQFGEIEKESSN